jgi:hypothetical protein
VDKVMLHLDGAGDPFAAVTVKGGQTVRVVFLHELKEGPNNLPWVYAPYLDGDAALEAEEAVRAWMNADERNSARVLALEPSASM